jgi:DNA-binding NarL/FixJ family response regulator
LPRSPIRVLVVDDYEPFRRFVCSTLQKQPELQIVGDCSDGLEAVQKAQELQPDLILLDIGLPTLNGIEAGRRIRQLSPKSKILFLSENRSPDIVEEALRTGAQGYLVKSDAGSELMPAVKVVLEGEQFVSSSLAGDPNEPQSNGPNRDNVIPFRRLSFAHHHEVGFYSDDKHFLDQVTKFVGAALKAGNAAIVVATESHRESLLPRLKAYGVDLAVAIDQDSYIALDAAETLSAFMVNDLPDPVRFLEAFGDLIVTATEAAVGKQSRVSVFGEYVHLLLAQGNPEAAIQNGETGKSAQ